MLEEPLEAQPVGEQENEPTEDVVENEPSVQDEEALDEDPVVDEDEMAAEEPVEDEEVLVQDYPVAVLENTGPLTEAPVEIDSEEPEPIEETTDQENK